MVVLLFPNLNSAVFNSGTLKACPDPAPWVPPVSLCTLVSAFSTTPVYDLPNPNCNKKQGKIRVLKGRMVVMYTLFVCFFGFWKLHSIWTFPNSRTHLSHSDSFEFYVRWAVISIIDSIPIFLNSKGKREKTPTGWVSRPTTSSLVSMEMERAKTVPHPKDFKKLI